MGVRGGSGWGAFVALSDNSGRVGVGPLPLSCLDRGAGRPHHDCRVEYLTCPVGFIGIAQRVVLRRARTGPP